MKVKVTTYKHEGEDYLLFETTPPFLQSERFIPAGNGHLGCTLLDSAKNLGVSKEAIKVLGELEREGGSFAPIMWWKDDTGRENFAWLGGVYGLMEAKYTSVDRDFGIHNYTEIPNEPPQEAIDAIISRPKCGESCENCSCEGKH